MKEITKDELEEMYSKLGEVASESNSYCNFALRGDGVFVNGKGEYADPYQVLQHMGRMRKIINEMTQFLASKI